MHAPPTGYLRRRIRSPQRRESGESTPWWYAHNCYTNAFRTTAITSGITLNTRRHRVVRLYRTPCPHAITSAFRKHSSHALSYACTEPRAHMASALATVGAPTVASHTAAPLGSRTPRSAIRPPHTPAAPFGRRTPCSAIRPPHTPAAPFGSHTAQQPKSASKQQGRTHHVAEPGCTSSSRGETWMSVTGPCERSACGQGR